MKKIIVILITTFTLVANVYAGSDGELILKKNEPSEIKDCSETFNKASFALNQGLDKIIFKPVSSVYRVLPSPVKTGVSNSLNNLSNVKKKLKFVTMVEVMDYYLQNYCLTIL